MKKVMICLMLCSALLFVGCKESDKSVDTAAANNQTTASASENTDSSTTNTDNKDSDSSKKDSNSNKSTTDIKKVDNTAAKTNTVKSSTSKSGNTSSNDSTKTENIAAKVKPYILGDQGKNSEAERVRWSSSFLNNVDVSSMYKQYIADGGNKNSVDDFASYITKNAPIQSNWKKLFEADLQAQYGVKVTKLESLGNDMYQAYVMNDGKEVPYVAVNARTGYYHG